MKIPTWLSGKTDKPPAEKKEPEKSQPEPFKQSQPISRDDRLQRPGPAERAFAQHASAIREEIKNPTPADKPRELVKTDPRVPGENKLQTDLEVKEQPSVQAPAVVIQGPGGSRTIVRQVMTGREARAAAEIEKAKTDPPNSFAERHPDLDKGRDR